MKTKKYALVATFSNPSIAYYGYKFQYYRGYFLALFW